MSRLAFVIRLVIVKPETVIAGISIGKTSVGKAWSGMPSTAGQ
jgi:hypothetical protein